MLFINLFELPTVENIQLSTIFIYLYTYIIGLLQDYTLIPGVISRKKNINVVFNGIL